MGGVPVNFFQDHVHLFMEEKVVVFKVLLIIEK
jgi:hypothetical protein